MSLRFLVHRQSVFDLDAGVRYAVKNPAERKKLFNVFEAFKLSYLYR